MANRLILIITLAIASVAQMSAQGVIGSLKLHPVFGNTITNIIDTGDVIYYVSDNTLYSYDKANDESDSYSRNNRLNDCSIKDIYYNNDRKYLAVDGGMFDNPRYALYQAKYTAKKKISFEISITMTSTWLDENLAIHENQKLGEFRICLPDIKFDKNNPKVTYGKKDSNNLLSGFCFFIPRSYGAYVNGQQYKECWGKGEFDITINVVESTGRSGKRNSTAEFALEYLQSEFPSAIQGLATNDNIMGAKTVKIITSY